MRQALACAQDMTSSEMTALYCLAHLVARQDGRKFVSKAAAIRAWRLVMHGRFRRLEDWCTYVAAAPITMVSEDLWRQVRLDRRPLPCCGIMPQSLAMCRMSTHDKCPHMRERNAGA